MRSHGLRQLVDDKSIASCQQTCCKLIVKTSYPQACCKLFQQVVTNLQIESCNKSDLTDLVTNCNKIDNVQEVCGIFGRVDRNPSLNINHMQGKITKM